MALKLYMDHNVPRAITDGLRDRNVDVLTAFEDGSHKLLDPDLLSRVTELSRVLFTNDTDFLAEAQRRQQSGEFFSGVIFAPQKSISIGRCVSDLELIANALEPDDLAKSQMQSIC
jgi:predicted nuclease of predicted toxin-antitoxin system